MLRLPPGMAISNLTHVHTEFPQNAHPSPNPTISNYTCSCKQGFIRIPIFLDGGVSNAITCRPCEEQTLNINCGLYQITEIDCSDLSMGDYTCTPCPVGANRKGLIKNHTQCFCTEGKDCPCVVPCPSGTFGDKQVM